MFPMQYDLLHKLEAKEKQDRARQQQIAKDAERRARQSQDQKSK